jgi:hypothetical protein
MARPKKAKIGHRQLVDEVAAAEYLSCQSTELKGSRCTGRGRFAALPFYRIGARIRYDLSDLDAYLDSCRVEPVRAVEPEVTA